MKLVVYLVGQILYRSLVSSKKTASMRKRQADGEYKFLHQRPSLVAREHAERMLADLPDDATLTKEKKNCRRKSSSLAV